MFINFRAESKLYPVSALVSQTNRKAEENVFAPVSVGFAVSKTSHEPLGEFESNVQQVISGCSSFRVSPGHDDHHHRQVALKTLPLQQHSFADMSQNFVW